MRALLKLIRPVPLAWAVSMLSLSSGLSQQPAAPKRVLVLGWYDRSYPIDEKSNQDFRAALESAAPGRFEYYAEYLETNKFPGDKQYRILRHYLRKKYAGRKIDVVVTLTSPPLNFLLERRNELFPHAPIVFAYERPVDARAMSDVNATGIVYAASYRETLDLALKLHPGTKHVFIVSGTRKPMAPFEPGAREALRDYKGTAEVVYLTDLTLEQLRFWVKRLPKESVILYVWQQSLDKQGRVLESSDILALIAREAEVPIYGMSHVHVGNGIVGGYVWTPETRAAKLAAIALRVANGARTADIPIEKTPAVLMFDWRQLQRWGIDEDSLPPQSVIRFREPSVWQQYKWRIVGTLGIPLAGVLLIFLLQGRLIRSLLIERRRSWQARQELQSHQEQLERVVRERTEEFVRACDQAQAANRAKSIFLANVSHELRTPLNAILGFTDIILRDKGLLDKHRKDLAIVGRSGEHLLGLIDGVLDMAKIESGGAALKTASFDLHVLLHDTVNMLRERAQAKNLELVLDVSSSAPQFVRSDPGRLRQVLTNLIENALKYTDEGSVAVRAAGRRDSLSGSTLIFDVEDTGIGIAEEDQARIFETFVQAGDRRTRSGSGLGLAVSQRLVQLLGGTILVESVLGRGSRFRVELPAQLVEERELAAEATEVEQVAGLEPGQPEHKILIVEDQRENWLLLQRLLQTAGFEVQVVGDGRHAVEAFEKWRPHFIWMDVLLPGLSGFEAAKLIRRLEDKREVKIVAVTASAFLSQREEVLAAGFDDFVRKPYRPKEVFDCMARHLGVRYLYQARSPHAADDLPATLRPEDLADLPAALRDELENAVVCLNRERTALLIQRISEQSASVGGLLARLADQLAYTSIFDALQKCKSRFTNASA